MSSCHLWKTSRRVPLRHSWQRKSWGGTESSARGDSHIRLVIVSEITMFLHTVHTVAVAATAQDARIAGTAAAVALGTDLLHAAVCLATNVALGDVEDGENALD